MALASFLTLNFIAEAVSLIIILYLLSKLMKFREAQSMQYMRYEAKSLQKIFSSALAFLAVSIMLTMLAIFFGFQEGMNPGISQGLRAGSSVFRLIFFVYLLKAVAKSPSERPLHDPSQ